jgi:hypothetical protein
MNVNAQHVTAPQWLQIVHGLVDLGVTEAVVGEVTGLGIELVRRVLSCPMPQVIGSEAP